MLSCVRISVRCSRHASLFGASTSLHAPRKAIKVDAQTLSIRLLSTKDIFGNVDLSLPENLSKIPALMPPVPKPTVEELVSAGHSVLKELDLWTWWKPTSYLRWALESMHMGFDIPWWTTIMLGTCVLRLIFAFVPISMQRMIAKQSQVKKETDEFRRRMQEARAESNNLLAQQVLLEQRDFFLSKGIKMGRQMILTLINGGIFATQFFAIKKMAVVNYPGFSTGGALWFHDLTIADPYFILPMISALSMFLVIKVGVEFGTSSNQMGPGMRIAFQYGMPIIIFAFSTQFSSAITVYWVTTNFISLLYSCLFQIPAIRRALSIPAVMQHKTTTNKPNVMAEFLKQRKDKKNAPPTIEELRKKDAEIFKKAGRAKPVVKADSS